MKSKTFLIAGFILASNFCSAQKNSYSVLKPEPVDMARVAEIADMLPDTPRGFGDPIEVRSRWDQLNNTGSFKAIINEADSISGREFPRLTEEIYLSYYKGKDSETSKRFIMKRRVLLTKLVLAECLSNRGRYLPSIEKALTDILETTSWTFPAEDTKKTNYLGTAFTIGLSSSAYGYDMAQTLYLLNSRLPVDLKKKIMNALYKKIFYPTLQAIKNNNANGEFASLSSNGNHNSATLSGVTGAALAVIADKRERAVFAAIAERYSNNFVSGYLDDGYCTEGIGYYTYGFGHYMLIREQLWQSTKGKVDLLKRPKIAEMATFSPRMEMTNGVYAAIGDCEQYIKPGQFLMYYLNKNFSLGLEEYDTFSVKHLQQPALSSVMYFFPNSASNNKGTVSSSGHYQLRSYFKKAGVLTVRPAPAGKFNMAATFKGGNNNEQHNHNDLGSYSIAIGGELLMGDPGLATYTPKYFGPERYRLYKTTASYGHPVPLVADAQQRAGKDALAEIITTDFTEKKDVFAMDIKSAYPVPSLSRLVRTFTYDRSNSGYIEVKDEYAFDTAQLFETAIITRCTWKQVGSNQFVIYGRGEGLAITIQAPVAFKVSSEEINEGPSPYTRISIALKETTKSGSVTVTYKPVNKQ